MNATSRNMTKIAVIISPLAEKTAREILAAALNITVPEDRIEVVEAIVQSSVINEVERRYIAHLNLVYDSLPSISLLRRWALKHAIELVKAFFPLAAYHDIIDN